MRMRRLRRSDSMRALVRETTLDPGDLIYPLFICPGEGVRREVSSMPGVFNLSVDQALREAEEAASLGIGGLLLFGLPESKDEQGTGAWSESGIVQQSLRALRQSSAAKNLVLIADVCLCEYTSHGHCGIVVEGRDGFEVDNDPSLNLLARTALSLAQAGADVVAPSDMMDGRVAAIRKALDSEGHAQTPILSYASKFASAFYGPFREAADSAPQFGDRKTYQMDGANLREAMRDIKFTPMGGKGKSVQADETYYGNTSKRAKHYKKGHSQKASIVALVEKPSGRVSAVHMKQTATAEDVREVIVTRASRKSDLHTDESRLYIEVGKEFASHKTVRHGWNQSGHYVGKDGQTTNAVENFFGTFKRGMRGTYIHCSEQHLQRYLAEFEFRHNNRSGLGISDGKRTALAMKGIEGKRLTYR